MSAKCRDISHPIVGQIAQTFPTWGCTFELNVCVHIHVQEEMVCTVDDDGADSSVDQFGLGGHAGYYWVWKPLLWWQIYATMMVVIVGLLIVVVVVKSAKSFWLVVQYYPQFVNILTTIQKVFWCLHTVLLRRRQLYVLLCLSECLSLCLCWLDFISACLCPCEVSSVCDRASVLFVIGGGQCAVCSVIWGQQCVAGNQRPPVYPYTLLTSYREYTLQTLMSMQEYFAHQLLLLLLK